MNLKRTTVLWMLVFSIIGMMLFPPFQMHIQATDINMGYAPIFNPPRWENYRATINVSVLVAQWLGVMMIAGIVWFFAENEHNPESSPNHSKHDHINDSVDFNSINDIDFQTFIRSKCKLLHSTFFSDEITSWLLLLIIQMLFIAPFVEAVRISLESFHLNNAPSTFGLQLYKVLIFTLFLCTTSLSIYGGISLTNKREWSTVKQAARILWLTGPVAIIISHFLLPGLLLKGMTETYSIGSAIGYLFCSVVIASAWSVYLARTEIIREIYYLDLETEEYDEDTSLETDSAQQESKIFSNNNAPFLIILIFLILIFGVVNMGSKPQPPIRTQQEIAKTAQVQSRVPLNIQNPNSIQPRTLETAQRPDFVAGESFILESIDPTHPSNNHKTKRTITAVFDETFDLAVVNLNNVNGKKRLLKFNKAWNLIAIRNTDQSGSNFSPPLQYYDFPLFPGKHWRQKSIETNIKSDDIKEHHISGTVGNWEDITVPAGRFHALKVSLQTELVNPKTGKKTTGTDISWYAPKVKRSIKSETTLTDATGKLEHSTLQLLEYDSPEQ